MTAKKTHKRKYDSSGRPAQARRTGLQIAEAARVLFLERGYAKTTIEGITENANVAAETIYATFRNKRNISSFLLATSVGGDHEQARLVDRPDPQAVFSETDHHPQFSMFAHVITLILHNAGGKACRDQRTIPHRTQPAASRRADLVHNQPGTLPVIQP